MVCTHKYTQVKHNKGCMELGGQHVSGESNHLIQHKNKLRESQEEQIYLVYIIVCQIYGWKQKKKIQQVNYMRMLKCDHHPIFQ